MTGMADVEVEIRANLALILEDVLASAELIGELVTERSVDEESIVLARALLESLRLARLTQRMLAAEIAG